LASISQILPGRSVDYYLGELPYCQGLQLQAIELAKNGIDFDTPTNEKRKNFKEVAGFF
tara:strand:+ start:4199 stop:4375 length:177 start_codon:yes stop_codon:yes gene_type:complete